VTKLSPNVGTAAKKIDYLRVNQAGRVQDRLFNSDDTDYSVKSKVSAQEVNLIGNDDKVTFNIQTAIDPKNNSSTV
jgi:hypothetical protein